MGTEVARRRAGEADRAGCKRTRGGPNCASRPLHGQRRTALNVGGTRNPPLGREIDPALTFVDGFSCLPAGNWDSWSPPSHRLLFGRTRTATRRDRALDHAYVVAVAGAVGLVVTVGLWLRHGGIGAANGLGGSATALGQITALIGTYAVLVQLLLMSRITWIESAIGLDRLAVWHRWVGFATVWLLTRPRRVHDCRVRGGRQRVTLVPDARLRDALPRCADGLGGVRVVHRGGGDLGTRGAAQARPPDVVLRAPVRLSRDRADVRTSTRGRDRLRQRPRRHVCGGWVCTRSCSGRCCGGESSYRLHHNRRHRLRVKGVQHEAPGVTSIYISGRHLDELDAQPGQFFLWRFLTPSGWWQAHPFSLSAAPTRNVLRITVKDLGDYTHRLQHLEPGPACSSKDRSARSRPSGARAGRCC